MNYALYFAHGDEQHVEHIPDIPVGTELKWWALGIIVVTILSLGAYFFIKVFRTQLIRLFWKFAKPLIKHQHILIERLYKILLPVLICIGLSALLIVVITTFNGNVAILRPTGTISQEELNLIIFTSLLSLIIVIPVFSLTFYIVWRYRVTNKRPAKYSPDWDHSRTLEAIWWLVPLLLISILGVIIWKSSHTLDPYKSISSTKKPLTIQVIALDWKWLFIYPDQHVATVNYVQLPKDRPVDFQITADAPMNSFWIPQLGGQIYAMPGMETHLHLQPSKYGDYRGTSANISGKGFAGMHFTAKVTSDEGFDEWVALAQHDQKSLTHDVYHELAEPSEDVAPTTYRLADPTLYDTVMLSYMMPGASHDTHESQSDMDHMEGMH